VICHFQNNRESQAIIISFLHDLGVQLPQLIVFCRELIQLLVVLSCFYLALLHKTFPWRAESINGGGFSNRHRPKVSVNDHFTTTVCCPPLLIE
jgi:hypothetical protein